MSYVHLKDKFEEAKHFLSIMNKEKESETPVRFNFSAFLTSSRCVFQYGLEIFKSLDHERLYKQWINDHSIAKFFKDKRDINIHEKPVSPNLQINVKGYETIGITESIVIVLKDTNGNIKDSYQNKGPKINDLPTKQTTTTFSYFLENWLGPEDLFEACQLYLDEIQEFIVFVAKYKSAA